MIKKKIKKILMAISGNYKHLCEKKIPAKKKWFGNNYGGFYVIPSFINSNSIIYSFGIGEDVSFDNALINEFQCNIYGFDPTPKSINWVEMEKKKIGPLFNFYEFGIGAHTGEVDFFLPKNIEHVSGSFVNQINVNEKEKVTVLLKSFKDIVSELGHKKVDVVKMDIEGAEYLIIDSILDSGIDIDQLLIEIHDRFFTNGKELTKNAIVKLRNYGYETYGVSDSFEEISFVRKSKFL